METVGLATMGLKLASVWQRLRILLAYHGKLVEENRDKVRMDKASRKIRHLVYLLEKYKGKVPEGVGFDD